jgi:hypothetical protein
MQMTNEEIYRDYRQAKDPKKQIGILAELNQCDRRTIKKIIDEYEPDSELEKLQERIKRGRPPKKETVEERVPESKEKLPQSVVNALLQRSDELASIMANLQMEIEAKKAEQAEINAFLKAN